MLGPDEEPADCPPVPRSSSIKYPKWAFAFGFFFGAALALALPLGIGNSSVTSVTGKIAVRLRGSSCSVLPVDLLFNAASNNKPQTLMLRQTMTHFIHWLTSMPLSVTVIIPREQALSYTWSQATVCPAAR